MILDAAWALFLERGVGATSIEAIAAKAGVSKVTLYSYFADKTALFRAAVGREMERIETSQKQGPAGSRMPGIADQLRAFGLGLLSFLTSKPAIDFYSVVAGELRRHDDLARAFYELGPGRTRANLARLIASAAARGELCVPDGDVAADELFGLWQGFSNFQLALDVDVDAIRHDLEARVDRGIRLFMLAYGPRDREA